MSRQTVETDHAREGMDPLREDAPPSPPAAARHSRGDAPRRSRATSLFSRGEPMVWLTGGSLVICVVMILGLIALIFTFGLSTFWPSKVLLFKMDDGGAFMGEVTRSERFRLDATAFDGLAPAEKERIRAEYGAGDGEARRRLVRTGNYRLTQRHFQWLDDFRVRNVEQPEWALVVERREWGRFYGFPTAYVQVVKPLPGPESGGASEDPEAARAEALALLDRLAPRLGGRMMLLGLPKTGGADGPILAAPDAADSLSRLDAIVEAVEDPQAAWSLYQRFHGEVLDRLRVRRGLEKDDTGKINDREEKARLQQREAKLEVDDAAAEYETGSEEYAAAQERLKLAQDRYARVKDECAEAFTQIRGRIREIDEQNGRFLLALRTAGFGATPPRDVFMGLADIVRAYPANRLTFLDRVGVYLSRWWEFLSDEPREANSEGGVFPAIFGTVLMTLMMALAVVPFGVLAALYLREYAKAGPLVSAVRIAVNNLAGVPSIVFGVFGLGFFCYGVGSYLDGGPSWTLPKPGWFLLLGGAAVLGTGAFLCFLAGMTRPGQGVTPRQRTFKIASLTLWGLCALAVVLLAAFTPFFEGFYRARLPNPSFGKGALIWASLTLALLTLPVVIVATEEALAAVPNSMREGSYACGAGKWQTIRRIVLPRALPGIMTGMILAMARGAGEVAPLMLVGAVKLAPELPLDLGDPGRLFGLNRSFMHLGFHIYDVGFQSQNSEAAKPMVFTTTLLLIAIVALLNVTAIWLRSRLRRRFVESHF